MNCSVTWFGHSAFMLEGKSSRVLIDPFFDGNPACESVWQDIEKPDLVLVTHTHGDHLGNAVEICKAHAVPLGCVVDSAPEILEKGLPSGLLLNGIGFNIGGTMECAGMRITMVQAFHSTPSGVAVGYIIQLDSGITIYHAGDTCVFADMQTWGLLYSIDLALLPIGGVFTMDARQAALSAAYLKAKKTIAMHWGTFPVLEQSEANFANELKKFAPECQLQSVSKGKKEKINF